jgi:hypothetical protein
MRKLILTGLIAILALPAGAAKRLTVAQLEQKLDAFSQAHRDDVAIVMQLSEMELTERLTEGTLESLHKKLPLGPKTSLALQLLADQSALLDPPANEIPGAVYPDAATQAKLLAAARNYVQETLPRLPNLLATRTTYSFDDSPQALKENYLPVRAGFHLIGRSSQEIAFSDSKVIDSPLETEDQLAVKSPAPRSVQMPLQLGLHPGSEYGWATALVMADSANGQITWSHWEQKSDGLIAVFHYSVPPNASHYVVSYCCIRPSSIDLQTSRRRMAGMPGTTTDVDAQSLTEKPGYHGSISIDPATGAILRVTIDADMKIGAPLARAAFIVQYGPVVLGDRASIFPQWSMTLSEEQGNPAVVNRDPPARVLNETTFSHYHRLGSSMRMIAVPVDNASGNPPADPSAVPASSPAPALGTQSTPAITPAPASNPAPNQ